MSNTQAAKKATPKAVAKVEKISKRSLVNAYFIKELAKKASAKNPDGMGDTAWRKHILAEISSRFDLDDSGAATAYNFAKKKCVAEGLIEDFARSGRLAGVPAVAKNVPKNAQVAATKVEAKPAAKATAKTATKKAPAKKAVAKTVATEVAAS